MFERLKAPFDPKRVSWRVGSITKEQTKGMALAYIDARDVMERLDEVVGPSYWQDRYEVHGNKTICYLSLRVGPEHGEWVTKADAAGDSAVEAEKGAISDAFKRAAVKWGIGRYLYDIDSPWVALENKRIVPSEFKKLEALLGGVKAPPTPKEPPAPKDDKLLAAVKFATEYVMGVRTASEAEIARLMNYPEAAAIIHANETKSING